MPSYGERDEEDGRNGGVERGGTTRKERRRWMEDDRGMNPDSEGRSNRSGYERLTEWNEATGIWDVSLERPPRMRATMNGTVRASET